MDTTPKPSDMRLLWASLAVSGITTVTAMAMVSSLATSGDLGTSAWPILAVGVALSFVWGFAATKLWQLRGIAKGLRNGEPTP